MSEDSSFDDAAMHHDPLQEPVGSQEARCMVLRVLEILLRHRKLRRMLWLTSNTLSGYCGRERIILLIRHASGFDSGTHV